MGRGKRTSRVNEWGTNSDIETYIGKCRSQCKQGDEGRVDKLMYYNYEDQKSGSKNVVQR